MKASGVRSLAIAAFMSMVVVSGGEAAAQCSCEKSTLDTVKERGSVIIGVRKDTPNFGFVDEKGELAGFDIDMARAIAEKLGVEPEFEEVTSATRVPLLQQGRIDMIIATLTHYRSRDDAIDFSIGYFYGAQSVMVLAESGITSLAELKGKRVGSVIGAAALDNLAKLQEGVELQTFEGYPESFVALQQGLIDGVVTDILMLSTLRASAPDPSQFVFIDERFAGGEHAVGLRENDSKWRDAINHAIMEVAEDGTWDALYDKWFGASSSIGIDKAELGWTLRVDPQ